MGPGSPVRKVGWEEHRDVEITHLSSPTNAILHNSSHVLPPSNVREPMLVKPVATPALPTLLTKNQPGEGSMRTENAESRRSSTLKRLSSSISTTLLPSHPSRSIYLQFLFAGVVTICLLWTVLLIMLNTAPNYTVNRVMATEDFDNGVFWLFVDPSPYLLWLTVLGLSVAGGGYVAILIKMVVRPKRRVSQAPRPSPKIDATSRQSEKISTADQIARRVTSSAKLVISLATTDSSSRQLALGMKIGDLAFETVLLFQVLEAGSPKPIVAIFTFIIASNALVCAATMFLQSKRIGLVETLVDLL
ncbi:10 kda heat shock protein, partial [Phytophthora pseudosyringae]